MNAPERALSNEPRVNLAAFLLADKPAERTAFVTPERSLAYGALATCVRAAASGLAARGIDERTRVLLMLEDDLELVVLFLASLAVGAVPAILSSRLDAKSLQAIVERAEPSVVFVADGNDEPVRAATRGGGVRPEIVRVSRFVSGNGPSGVRATGFPGPDADPAWDGFVPKDWEALSFLQFTSGSSGEPKGVMHANRSAIAGCRMVARDLLAIRPDDIVYATSKTFFGFGQGASILFPLFAGATAVLDPRWSRPDVAAENIARFRPTMVFAVPSLYRRLLAFDGDLFRTARVAFASGAGLPHNLSIAFEQHFGLKLHEGYGSTELFHLAAAGYPDAPPAGSLGRMLPDVAYEIRTAAGEPAGVERVGELHVNSPATISPPNDSIAAGLPRAISSAWTRKASSPSRAARTTASRSTAAGCRPSRSRASSKRHAPISPTRSSCRPAPPMGRRGPSSSSWTGRRRAMPARTSAMFSPIDWKATSARSSTFRSRICRPLPTASCAGAP